MDPGYSPQLNTLPVNFVTKYFFLKTGKYIRSWYERQSLKSQNFCARESRTIIIIVSSCIDRCEHLQLRLKNLKLIKVKKSDENTNIQDLPIEVQGRVFYHLILTNFSEDFFGIYFFFIFCISS